MHTCEHAYMHTYIHYITLHYITLRYIHYIHTYITLHYITLHYITLHYLQTYIHTYIKNIKNITYITYMHTSIHPYIHTCIHAYMHTCIHAYMHTCIQIHSTYTYIYLHTYRKKNICMEYRMPSGTRGSRMVYQGFEKIKVWNGHFFTLDLGKLITLEPLSYIWLRTGNTILDLWKKGLLGSC